MQILIGWRVNQECFLRCSGYGDLWDEIQNLPENDRDSSVHGLSVSSQEAEGSKENSESERKEESSDWKSEEEENGDEEDNTDNEDKEEDEKGTICSCNRSLFCAVKIAVMYEGGIQGSKQLNKIKIENINVNIVKIL